MSNEYTNYRLLIKLSFNKRLNAVGNFTKFLCFNQNFEYQRSDDFLHFKYFVDWVENRKICIVFEHISYTHIDFI